VRDTAAEPHPYIAWAENSKLIVKRFESGKWNQLGEPFGAPGDSSAAACPALIFDSSGGLVIAWSQGTPSTIHLRKWVDPQWDTAFISPLDGAPGDTRADCPLLASGGSTKLAAAWVEANPGGGGKSLHVQHYVGPDWARWDPIPGTPGATMVLGGLVLDGAGLPVVAWQEALAGASTIHVRRWDDQGKKWIDLGGALAPIALPEADGPPGLAVDRTAATFAPFLAWFEQLDKKVAVRTWQLAGDVWQPVGSLLRGMQTGSPAEIGLSYGGGAPYVVFTDIVGNNRALYSYYLR
jgi:hypothetical protein